jgi:hypothetical protein
VRGLAAGRRQQRQAASLPRAPDGEGGAGQQGTSSTAIVAMRRDDGGRHRAPVVVAALRHLVVRRRVEHHARDSTVKPEVVELAHVVPLTGGPAHPVRGPPRGRPTPVQPDGLLDPSTARAG